MTSLYTINEYYPVSPISRTSCLQKIRISKWTDVALLIGCAALFIIGVLASLGIFNFIGTTNAAYFSYCMYVGAALFFVTESVRIAVNHSVKEPRNQIASLNPEQIHQFENEVNDSIKKDIDIYLQVQWSNSRIYLRDPIEKQIKAVINNRSFQQDPLGYLWEWNNFHEKGIKNSHWIQTCNHPRVLHTLSPTDQGAVDYKACKILINKFRSFKPFLPEEQKALTPKNIRKLNREIEETIAEEKNFIKTSEGRRDLEQKGMKYEDVADLFKYHLNEYIKAVIKNKQFQQEPQNYLNSWEAQNNDSKNFNTWCKANGHPISKVKDEAKKMYLEVFAHDFLNKAFKKVIPRIDALR